MIDIDAEPNGKNSHGSAMSADRLAHGLRQAERSRFSH
jgi:hypothetical protein